MTLVIDASNIRAGGGLTHLIGILKFCDLETHCFRKVVVFSNEATLKSLPNKDWLVKETHPYLNKSFLWSFFFQIFKLSKLAVKEHQCTIIFAPGGTFFGGYKPFVTMSRNMLPFEFEEAFRFKSWRVRLRFILLFITQSITFKRANGTIFLTKYAKNSIMKRIKLAEDKTIIIPHGINKTFSYLPKKQMKINEYTNITPFKFLYVSIINAYKHQWNVAEAVLKLREEGFPLTLDLIGPSSKESIGKLTAILESKQNKSNTINYIGAIEHFELAQYYKKSDAFVFASSCENMPNILIEAMTAGLPIACSNKGPMPEVLGDAGLYFDPTDVNTIYDCLKKMVSDKNLRAIIAEKAYKKTMNYTWKECSEQTFKYLSKIAKHSSL